MGQIDFYQVGQDGLEQGMIMLLKKTLAAKQKILVLSKSIKKELLLAAYRK